jgi:hypothetical protein
VPLDNFAGFGGLARIMCEHLGRPATDAPLLANMLANVVYPKGSGKVPAGKYTRKMIVAWLTGEKYESRRTTAREKRRRRQEDPARLF